MTDLLILISDIRCRSLKGVYLQKFFRLHPACQNLFLNHETTSSVDNGDLYKHTNAFYLEKSK